MNEPEFVFTRIHATVLEQEGDDLVQSALTPACDFCLDTRVAWEYPCATFTLDNIGFGSDDGWLACETCAGRIEARDFGGLSARSVRSWITRHGSIERFQLDWMGQIQHGFLDHRNGPRIPVPDKKVQ